MDDVSKLWNSKTPEEQQEAVRKSLKAYAGELMRSPDPVEGISHEQIDASIDAAVAAWRARAEAAEARLASVTEDRDVVQRNADRAIEEAHAERDAYRRNATLAVQRENEQLQARLACVEQERIDSEDVREARRCLTESNGVRGVANAQGALAVVEGAYLARNVAWIDSAALLRRSPMADPLPTDLRSRLIAYVQHKPECECVRPKQFHGVTLGEGGRCTCGLADLLALVERPRECVIGEYCSTHQFVHGAEAEELNDWRAYRAYRGERCGPDPAPMFPPPRVGGAR